MRENRVDLETGTVRTAVSTLSIHDLEGTLDHALEVISDLKRLGDVSFSVEPIQYEEGYELAVWIARPETEDEREARLRRAQEDRERKIAYKRTQLEALKKELGES